MEMLKCDTVVRYLSSAAPNQEEQHGEVDDDFS
jgi:hypothetical protein